MPGRDSFPATWLILALAATHPTMTISYKRMSELSSLINEPTTKSTFDHAFREVKKQAIALAEQAKQKEAAGEKLDEVKTGEAKKASPVKKGGKRAAEDDGEEDGAGDGTSSKKPVRKSRAKKAKISVKAEGGEEEEEE